MTLHDALHPAAIGFTVLAVCAHPGWRSREASIGLVAAILMLAGMIDTAYANLLSVVVWIPLLLAAAIGVSAARSVRRPRVRTGAGDGVWVTTHDPLGLVVTAAILPLMHVGSAPAGTHAGHGAPMGVLIALVVIIAAWHVVGSFLACVRNSATAERVQLVAMGISTSFMALSVAAS
ncbi:MAG: hypothetical protein ABWY26_11590 [Microbacterium sp.]